MPYIPYISSPRKKKRTPRKPSEILRWKKKEQLTGFVASEKLDDLPHEET